MKSTILVVCMAVAGCYTAAPPDYPSLEDQLAACRQQALAIIAEGGTHEQAVEAYKKCRERVGYGMAD